MPVNEHADGTALRLLTDRRAILVLGMHRSGTSALTRIISLLGAKLPKQIMGANEFNERGYWEPDRLVALHDQMFAEMASHWEDWRSWKPLPIGEDRIASYRAEIRQTLEEEYEGAPLFVLKDPRICRLVPLYESVLSEMGVIPLYAIPIRNPLAVTASLNKRDGTTESFAALMWLRYVLDVEYVTRGKTRLFTTYEELMADWRGVVDKMVAAFALEWPSNVESTEEAIENHLSSELQHHVFSAENISRKGYFGPWLQSVYTALVNLSRSHDETNFLVLDRVRRSFNQFAVQAGDVVFPELRRRENRLQSDINVHRQRADAEHTNSLRLRELLEAQTQRADAERMRAEAEQRNAAAQIRNAEEIRQFAEAETKRAEAERLRADAERRVAATMCENLEHEKREKRKYLAERDSLVADIALLRGHLRNAMEGIHAAQAEVTTIRNSTSWRITTPIRAVKLAFHRFFAT